MSTTAEVTPRAEAAFLELHKKYLETGAPPAALRALNEAGAERFEHLRFPYPKHEMYTFVNTKEIAATRFELRREGEVEADFVRSRVYSGCEDSHLVFVDGGYRPDLSGTSGLSGVRIETLETAAADPGLKSYLMETVENENDVFASLNHAFCDRGTFIDVESGAVAGPPLQLLYISTGSAGEPVMNTPRTLVRVGTQAEIQFLVKYAGVGSNYFVNSVQDFILNENCGVGLVYVQADDPDARHFSKTRVQQYRYSRFSATGALSGSRLTRRHTEIHLKENGAELNLRGVSVLKDRDQAHHFIRVHHEAPSCTSRQFFRNIVNGRARASMDGTVVVNKGAQQTCSDQLINHLMLSDEARGDAKPVLMIFADDVKCTHGNTVGQIDEEQMFYLKTRGLTQKTARVLLTRSFADAIINTIEHPAVVEDLGKTLLTKLEA